MNTQPTAPLTQSALDFEGLGKLRAEARQNDKAAVRETAQQFEAMFLQMMMKSMREAVEKDEENSTSGQDTFESMFDREVAHKMAQRNTLGVADMLVRQHEQRSNMLTSVEALQARDNAQNTPALRPLHAVQQAYPLDTGKLRSMAVPVVPALRPLQTSPGVEP
jgi:Rod binding domain-containing protein